MSQDDTYRAAVVRAAVILGSARALSERLGVPMPQLTRWLAGFDQPSIGMLLRVVDIVIEEERKPRLMAAANDHDEGVARSNAGTKEEGS